MQRRIKRIERQMRPKEKSMSSVDEEVRSSVALASADFLSCLSLKLGFEALFSETLIRIHSCQTC